jgi:hypothetical protein
LSVDLPRLHGVLKDKTRAHILELIGQRGSLSYVELLNLLEIAHTGNLNYHLRILGDLLVKDEESGRYSLSEKGRIAVELLGKFQTAASVDRRVKKAGLRGMYISAGMSFPIIGILLYFLNPTLWFADVMSITMGYAGLFVAYRMWVPYFETGVVPFSIRTRRIAMMYIFALVFLFINAGLLVLAESAFPAISSYPPYVLVLVGVVPGATIGALIGEAVGRRRNFEPIMWPL